jgi:multicomponent Na+:H+ antiporter subunit D
LAGAFVVGVAAIAGVPPFDGYVSVGLIHHALMESGQPVVLGLMIVAQTLTIAALGKAAWLAFFRRRDEPLEEPESLRAGMLVALVALSAACLASGAAPGILLHHVAEPAAGALLDPVASARAALGAAVRLLPAKVPFDYFDPKELALVALTLVAAVPLARWAMTVPEDGPVGRLRRAVQTGSVNDYAAYLIGGLTAVVAALTLR